MLSRPFKKCGIFSVFAGFSKMFFTSAKVPQKFKTPFYSHYYTLRSALLEVSWLHSETQEVEVGSMTEVPEDDWILMLLTKPSQLKDHPQSFCQHC